MSFVAERAALARLAAVAVAFDKAESAYLAYHASDPLPRGVSMKSYYAAERRWRSAERKLRAAVRAYARAAKPEPKRKPRARSPR